MSDVKWHPIDQGTYSAIWSQFGKESFQVFATHTCMQGCEFHTEPNMLTEWGFNGADFPLVKSLMTGERGTPAERWKFWIAEPMEAKRDE